jgi:hypothetical protein
MSVNILSVIAVPRHKTLTLAGGDFIVQQAPR